ncbi:MAG: GNAT family N-acetyltransferase [Clostridia bacterium]|nr:GNAT family N-acetyltransferase [Clostridia bacterium]
MFDLDRYLNALILSCRTAFGDRLLYVGLQGSQLRGEAHEGSDIDVMVILDRFSVQDMDRYREILNRIGFYESSCGFICGRDELLRWNPLEVCQLRHTTKDLFGDLTDYLPLAAREDEVNYVKLSLGNLYHELCHRYIHADRDKNIAKFRGACKGVFFLMQNLHYLETGHFILTKKELKAAVSAEDRRVLELTELPDGFDFDQAFSVLFAWCQSAFLRVEQLAKKGSAFPRWNTSEALQFLKADTSDALTLNGISRRAFDSDVLLGGPSAGGPPGYASVSFHTEMARQGHLFKLTDEGLIVGGAILFLQGDALNVGRIFVAPEHFRKGYGAFMMREIESMFPEVKEFTLDTPDWNSRTNSFYTKLGYTEIKRDSSLVYYSKRKADG